jgi:hypothetical protein
VQAREPTRFQTTDISTETFIKELAAIKRVPKYFLYGWNFQNKLRFYSVPRPTYKSTDFSWKSRRFSNRLNYEPMQKKTIKLLIGSNKESKLRSMRTSNWIRHKFITEETRINIARKGNSPRRIKKVVFFRPETVLQERRVTQTKIEGSNTE